LASAFGHAFAAYAIGSGFKKESDLWKFNLLGIFCAVIPDADVISFRFGVSYGDFWGHRGFTHSICFAIFLAVLISTLFYFKDFLKPVFWKYVLFFSICSISHGLLDMMTDGGMGVALFSPIDNTRYFLPWRPIEVSPMSASRFFSSRGLDILKSEFIWIGIPCVVYMLIIKSFRKNKI